MFLLDSSLLRVVSRLLFVRYSLSRRACVVGHRDRMRAVPRVLQGNSDGGIPLSQQHSRRRRTPTPPQSVLAFASLKKTLAELAAVSLRFHARMRVRRSKFRS